MGLTMPVRFSMVRVQELPKKWDISVLLHIRLNLNLAQASKQVGGNAMVLPEGDRGIRQVDQEKKHR